ncbi:MAG: chemotaxis protein [Deltaproteobacteria bacterium]|jgi:two-component system chemotaxis response regulator CheV|nr:chemotaxis protein [Deltaproteobacteria bacterium]
MTDEIKSGRDTALEVIEFYLDEVLADGSSYRSCFGMNVAKVLEIIRVPETVTGVPGKHHPAVMGTFNLRDRVMPLVDLASWLEKKPLPGNDGRKVAVVTEFSGVVTAFAVSGVSHIHYITWSKVEPPGKYLQYFSHDSVTGVMRIDGRIVFLLDMEHIISTMNPSLGLEHNAAQVADPREGAGRTILVADDSAMIRKTISTYLTRSGYGVVQATCGREAWEKLEKWKQESAAQDKPLDAFVDLVISDIEMPEMGGHELTRKIKNDPQLRTLPVVLFSSLISQVVLEDGRKAGADDQISKPDLPKLTSRVKDLIEKSKACSDGGVS